MTRFLRPIVNGIPVVSEECGGEGEMVSVCVFFSNKRASLTQPRSR